MATAHKFLVTQDQEPEEFPADLVTDADFDGICESCESEGLFNYVVCEIDDLTIVQCLVCFWEGVKNVRVVE